MKSPKQKFWQNRNCSKWIMTACHNNLKGLLAQNPTLLQDEIDNIEMARVSLEKVLENWSEANQTVKETMEGAI